MTQDSFQKHLRLQPDVPAHAKILEWMRAQRGSDNENLIHLMAQGLKVETGEISHTPSAAPASSVTQSTNTDLLPEIRKIVNAAIKSALREADISISQDSQEKLADEETQAFIIGMADNFG